ncbi:DUF4123 domain-containing protein [Pseudomonas nunensis]|uniref:DUF4123 domain-containing protein n=1 Tax=Pseudomonas nunensis TaxID=2961896 RepID=UPI0025AF3315|nr:DUF4123 domain-containing protein [Pseudomonas nunensis]
MQPDHFSPHAWLEQQPLKPLEQLFAIFSNASAAEPFKAWQRSMTAQAPSPIWADTAYAEWEAVMPFVGIVAADGEFLEWVAATESRDWGWLAISSASLEAVVDHLRSLTQALLPNNDKVFFRFWDGRYLLPMLQSTAVDTAKLLPVIGRCLINGRALEIGGRALKSSQVFPWWNVPETLLEELAAQSDVTRINNLLKWLSEDLPDLFEAFSDSVLRRKVASFLEAQDLPQASKQALVDYLMAELN